MLVFAHQKQIRDGKNRFYLFICLFLIKTIISDSEEQYQNDSGH